jgi:hypothetical protein
MNAAAARPVAVHVLSARAELLLVTRVAMAIAVAVWIYVAFAAGAGGGGGGRKNLLPFQRLIAERPAAEQRTFRELQEGLLEAESARAATGAWPAPDALGVDGIPPFAPDPTQRIRHTWTLARAGSFVNYLGVPASTDAPAWLVLVQEPEPGVLPDQAFEDEEHHRLPDGTMLHVSTWVHAGGRNVAAHLVRMPQAEGWLQLYAVGPLAALPAALPATSR